MQPSKRRDNETETEDGGESTVAADPPNAARKKDIKQNPDKTTHTMHVALKAYQIEFQPEGARFRRSAVHAGCAIYLGSGAAMIQCRSATFRAAS